MYVRVLRVVNRCRHVQKLALALSIRSGVKKYINKYIFHSACLKFRNKFLQQYSKLIMRVGSYYHACRSGSENFASINLNGPSKGRGRIYVERILSGLLSTRNARQTVARQWSWMRGFGGEFPF